MGLTRWLGLFLHGKNKGGNEEDYSEDNEGGAYAEGWQDDNDAPLWEDE